MAKAHKAKTLKEAHDLATSLKQFEYVAVGVDVQDRINLGLIYHDTIDISDIAELKGISINGDDIEIGALVTVAELLEHELIASNQGIVDALTHIANPQVRNSATVGGNLLQKKRCLRCRNPQFQGLVAHAGECDAVHPSTLGLLLVALDATVEIYQGNSLAVAKFFEINHIPTQIFTKITFSKKLLELNSSYHRLSKRQFGEWPEVETFCMANVVEGKLTDLRISAGAVANTPLKLDKTTDEYINSLEIPEKKKNYLAKSLKSNLAKLQNLDVILD